MRATKAFFLGAAAVGMAVFVQAAYAFDYGKAINLAGKQRMLTQKMSKESLLVALEIDKDANLAELKKTRDLFDKTLNGLTDGDAESGLEATKKPKIREQLDAVRKLWTDFDAAVTGVAGEGATPERIAVIADSNVPLLEEMDKAVKFYETDATGSGVNPALAVAVNLAGRQRMLTQKMSKEFFLVAYGYEKEAAKKSLSGTVATFDSTLSGLIDGNASVGLSPAPTAEIKAQLEKVKSLWTEFRRHVESEPTEETRQAVAAQNIPLLTEMDAAVRMFEKL
jgi:hypothetical protein